ncbi:hypothetical protein [Massilia antarctica]|uniref:hypothetical protein n=1 Tax=Massilia antarctica TaxID=2765360 RepID=UPI0006BB5CF3|nr:hypothetical protein [Massilia sp. H27-R4]MCY0912468.1 hypothetical protein [Massilia sp. H27-R4]CUI03514.1 hypothetical protein BN2497_1805 [Janthinobacterium sp. CG23_2]CUU27300.1 hypothetical protein BN3177_1805 [Janthinobacterium sp. CG23_2]
MHDIAAKLERVRVAIHAGFPAEVGEPVEHTLYSRVTNFFRNGPHRQVVVFTSDGVDFQYDEDAEKDDDYALEAGIWAAFEQVLEQAQGVLGAPLGERPLSWAGVMSIDEYDDDHEGESRDDTEWTPEYEQGALMDCDSTRTRYWFINGRHVFLQAGVLTGDDDIVGFVAMTVTPVCADVQT